MKHIGAVNAPNRGVSLMHMIKHTKLLLVEDDHLLQFVFKRQIQHLGFTPLTVVCDGIEAIKMAEKEKFDIIFMDINMPQLDGLQVTVRIREGNSLNSETTIIGLTSYGERHVCLQAGMNDYLRKPIILEDLLEIIAKWINPDTAHHSQHFVRKIKELRDRYRLD